MYELVQAGPCSYYLACPAKIGVYLKDGTDAYLIDGGSDATAAKKALQALAQNGWNLAGVLITHSNADHIGGNHLLQSRTGCRIYSSGAEAAITENPILSPSFVYGGFPFSDLRHKFLLAQPSCVTPFSDPSFPQEVGIIPLPGHCFEMVGFRTPDDTVFLADCVCSEQTLSKYAVTFCTISPRTLRRWTSSSRCRPRCLCLRTRLPRAISRRSCASTAHISAGWRSSSSRRRPAACALSSSCRRFSITTASA